MDRILVVCADDREAHRLRRLQDAKPPVQPVRFASQHSLAQISGTAPRVIVVMERVDLRATLAGEGPLEAVLRNRQRTWGDEAQFINLGAY